MTVHMKGVIYTCNMAAAPLPFRKHCDTWRVWGFENQPVRFTLPASSCEALLELLLYLQARSRGQSWTVTAVFKENGERFCIDALRVEYGLEFTLFIEYVIPTIRDCCILDHTEGCGFFWLGLMKESAYCLTKAEVLVAIRAIVPYIPIARLCHEAFLDRIKFKAYIHRRLVLESGDRMRVAALRRMLEGLEIPAS